MHILRDSGAIERMRLSGNPRSVQDQLPNAESTVYPWKEDQDVLAKTITQVREFLKAHQPAKTK